MAHKSEISHKLLALSSNLAVAGLTEVVGEYYVVFSALKITSEQNKIAEFKTDEVENYTTKPINTLQVSKHAVEFCRELSPADAEKLGISKYKPGCLDLN